MTNDPVPLSIETASFGFAGGDGPGLSIARHIAAQWPVLVHDCGSGILSGVGGQAQIVDTPAELASRSDVVFISVPSFDSDLETLLLGADGIGSQPGARVRHFVFVGPTAPAQIRTIEDSLAALGISTLAAPAMRMVGHENTDNVMTIVSGRADLYDLVRPLIAAYSAKIHYLGDNIALAPTMMLVNDMLSAASRAATRNALMLATRIGLDPAIVLSVLDKSTGQSGATRPGVALQTLDSDGDEDVRSALQGLAHYIEQAKKVGAPSRLGAAVLAAMDDIRVAP